MKNANANANANASAQGRMSLAGRAKFNGELRSSYGSIPDFNEPGKFNHGNNVVDVQNLNRRRALAGYEPIEQFRAWFLIEAEKNGWNSDCDKDNYYDQAIRTVEIGGLTS